MNQKMMALVAIICVAVVVAGCSAPQIVAVPTTLTFGNNTIMFIDTGWVIYAQYQPVINLSTIAANSSRNRT